MMYNYPFFTPFRYKNYYNNDYTNHVSHYVNNNKYYVNDVKGKKKPSQISSNFESEKVLNEGTSKKSNHSENSFFEILGLKLYYDDILLICLIFFLYKENVKDNYLLLALVMLLLS